ncbi:MAG: GNAT family N-acetyltransferase [Jatrophihabitantaceae bacterium]
MSWTFTTDPELYADRVLALLTSRPEANTLPLTVLETVRAGQQFGAAAPLFGWYAGDSSVTGAVSMTPPYGLLLAEVPAGSEADLVERLRQDQVEVPDVAGELATVDRFVAHWTKGTALTTEVLLRQRLYRLDGLRQPPNPPPGSARPATEADLDLVMDWMLAFQQEAEPRSMAPASSIYQRRAALGLLWFWCDVAGQPVAFAGRNVEVAGASRIGPVYTPPPFRQRGYGAAATHACSQDALDQGAQAVLLFTDLANPTSNSVYRSLGYRPVDERIIVKFD